MSNYRKTMADALREMYPLDEESQIDEATMSSSQIARLKTAYEPMRDKKISTSNADKLSAMMDKVGKDKEALIQLFKADIPFVSQSAVTKLITKHNMKGAEINKLREEADLDEGQTGSCSRW
jgi:DNA polymerase elongation subunit (family B)